MNRPLLAAFTAAALVVMVCGQARAAVCEAIAGNLVANCGFETNDLTGWTLTPAASGSAWFVGSTIVNSGNYAWNMGATNLIDDVISQLLPTVLGQEYRIEFYYNSVGDVPNGFTALWDASPLVSVSDTGPTNGYVHYSFLVTGTANDTISFGGHNTFGFDQLDDVSVVAVLRALEPRSLTLLGTSVAFLGLLWAAGRMTSVRSR